MTSYIDIQLHYKIMKCIALSNMNSFLCTNEILASMHNKIICMVCTSCAHRQMYDCHFYT